MYAIWDRFYGGYLGFRETSWKEITVSLSAKGVEWSDGDGKSKEWQWMRYTL